MAKLGPLTPKDVERYRKLKARKYLLLSERSELNTLEEKVQAFLDPEGYARKCAIFDLVVYGTITVVCALVLIWGVVGMVSQAVGLLSGGV